MERANHIRVGGAAWHEGSACAGNGQRRDAAGVAAGILAHDINNLLVAILGNAGAALAALPPESPLRGTVEEIERAGKRAAELALQLAETGQGRAERGLLDLNEVVRETTSLLRGPTAAEVAMEIELDEGLPAIEGDPTQLRRVVMNLLLNALEAVGEGPGTVSVRTVRRTDPGSPGWVCLEVADSGCGMERDLLERIFEPFYTTKAAGRGLGLAAAPGIIRSHGGTLEVESTPGEGTTFRVLLACSEAAEVGRRATIEPADSTAGGSVLVVDDEETVRTVTARALEAMGYVTMQAVDAEEAVAAVRSGDDIACVLLDLTMPGAGGEEAFARIAEIRPELPVVIMSGYGEHDVMSRFPGRGPAGFLQKPYELRTLAEAVRQAIAHARARAAHGMG